MNIIESIYNEPSRWTQHRHYLKHDEGLRIWTCNGLFHYNTYPEGRTGIMWKIRFAKAYQWWTENQPASKNQITQRELI